MSRHSEQPDDEILVCAHCGERIETKSIGNEFWHYCPSCEMIEIDTEEITVAEYERRHP